MVKKTTDRLKKAILETAQDMFDGGVIDEKQYKKITMRHLNKKTRLKVDLISSNEIRSIREEAHLSQAVFAGYLNLSVGYISQLERGLKEPKGAVLALLNVIRRKGFDVIIH